jgi:hypothetical protein
MIAEFYGMSLYSFVGRHSIVSKVTVLFCIQTAMNESSSFLPVLVLSVFWTPDILTGVQLHLLLLYFAVP